MNTMIGLLLAKLFGSLCVMLDSNYINNVSLSSGRSTVPGVCFIQHLSRMLSPEWHCCTAWAYFRSVSLVESRIPCFIKFSKSSRSWSRTVATAHHAATTVWRLPLFLMKYCILHQTQWPGRLLEFYFCLFGKCQMTLRSLLSLHCFSSWKSAMDAIFAQVLC